MCTQRKSYICPSVAETRRGPSAVGAAVGNSLAAAGTVIEFFRCKVVLGEGEQVPSSGWRVAV